ncbi:MAG: hypothetical protein NVS9B3_16480 [Gemmatimonadaceae bacterium]
MTTPAVDQPRPQGAVKLPARVQVAWAGGHRFDAHRPGGPSLRIDASGATGQSPVDALLSALATCASTDVVDILAKRRTPVSSLEVEVVGERASGVPARVTRVTLAFRIRGSGIDRAQAERAVELSVTKYCSVKDSLHPALPVEWSVDVAESCSTRTSGRPRWSGSSASSSRTWRRWG